MYSLVRAALVLIALGTAGTALAGTVFIRGNEVAGALPSGVREVPRAAFWRPAAVNILAGVPLTAAAAVVVEERTHRIVGWKGDVHLPRPLASLTKLFLALALARSPTPPQVVHLEGVAVPLDRARKLLLAISSNEAAEVLAAAGAWGGETMAERRNRTVAAMNAIAQALGLRSVRLSSPSGLDVVDGVPSAMGAPLDVARAALAVVRLAPAWAEASRAPVVMTPAHQELPHTAGRLARDPRLLLLKTGYTDAAGGNLAVVAAFPHGERYGIVVMGSTREGRVTDVELILDQLDRWWRSRPRALTR